MSRIIAWNLMTLDGYFEGPKSWDLGFHDLAWGKEMENLSIEQSRSADMLLFGRVTYQGMASYWTTATGEIADFMNSVPKTVFSTTLVKAEWNNTRLVSSDAAKQVARLRSEPGRDILIFGSALLCAGLLRENLIDEYRLGLVPVLLGAGNPLFKPGPEQKRMKLLEARPLETGCVILRYAPARA